MKTNRRGFALILALLLLLLAMGGHAAPAKAETYELFYFLNLFEGTALDLTQYWGKAYLLFFFTESSPESLQQIPEIKRIYESYSSDALQIVMIHEWANETEENTQNLIRQFGLENMTFFEDTDMSVAKKINLPGCPMTIFMNSGGYLFDAFVYAVNYNMMAEVLDAMEVPKGSPATPTPVETVAPVTETAAPATEAPTSDVAIDEGDYIDEAAPTTEVPTQVAPTEEAPTVVPFITKAPANTGAAPLTPPPGEGASGGGAPFGAISTVGTN